MRVNAVVMSRVQAEYDRQVARWDHQDHPDAVWFAILLEELGEAASAWKRNRNEGEHSMEAELTSVAAMVIQWLERVEERKVP